MNKKIILALLCITATQQTKPFSLLIGPFCGYMSNIFVEAKEETQKSFFKSPQILPVESFGAACATAIGSAALAWLTNSSKGASTSTGLLTFFACRYHNYMQYNHPTKLAELKNKFQQAKGAALYRLKTECPETYKGLADLKKKITNS